MDDFIAELRSGRDWLNDGKCCGQVCSDGVCCAPACVFGEALKYFYKAADMLEEKDRRIAELIGNREAWKGIQEGTAKILKEKEARIAELEDELQVAVVVHKSLDDRIKELESENAKFRSMYDEQLLMAVKVSAALEKKD